MFDPVCFAGERLAGEAVISVDVDLGETYAVSGCMVGEEWLFVVK